MARPRWKTIVKLALAVLVLAAVGRHVARTWDELHKEGRSPRLDPAWTAAAVGVYVVGLAVCGVFFGRVMQASPTPVGLGVALRAYLISHLGKYVPGKAMVVVMRAGLCTPFGARPATAAFATLYETLAMMAAGGLVAAAGFAAADVPPFPLPIGRTATLPIPTSIFALALGLALLVVVSPPVFPRLATLVRMPFPGVGPDALPRCDGRLLIEGIVLSSVGWLLLGLSQVAILRALLPGGVELGMWPRVIAAVALATAVGFVVPIAPGGLGVREWVLWTSLSSAIDKPMAVVAALALRLAWVVGELLAAAAVAWARPPRTGVVAS